MENSESDKTCAENNPEMQKSFKHLFKVIAKDLKTATKGHSAKSLTTRVTHTPENKIDN